MGRGVAVVNHLRNVRVTAPLLPHVVVSPRSKEVHMKDKTEGKWDETKGKIKEETGKVVGDRSTEWSGKADQAKGHIKEGIGNAKNDLDVEKAEDRDRTETPR
jgi:uncharacterized protein YjbJ (UPF0337 family)